VNKASVIPAFLSLLIAAGCGVPKAEHTKVANELSDCAKQRFDATSQANLCKEQVKGLLTENEGLKKEKTALQKDKDGLESRISELNAKAEKSEQLEKATQTYEDLRMKLEQEIRDGKIQISEMKNRLTMTMVDKILFASGSADVSKEGKLVLDKVIPVLKEIKDKRIQVEGHTDNVQIFSAIKVKYPTNWELATARATQVVRYLQEDGGIDPRLLSATGYSEYQPVAPNDSPEGKSKNRRIEIVLLPLVK
jgi:chemotaxis protein MotB